MTKNKIALTALVFAAAIGSAFASNLSAGPQDLYVKIGGVCSLAPTCSSTPTTLCNSADDQKGFFSRQDCIDNVGAVDAYIP